jgi:hypothetical protein
MFVGRLKKSSNALLRKKVFVYQSVIKDQLYGSILEMTKNRDLFRKSDIGQKHEYSHWTDSGKIAIAELIDDMTRKILIAENEELNDRAKKMVWDQLKEQEK